MVQSGNSEIAQYIRKWVVMPLAGKKPVINGWQKLTKDNYLKEGSKYLQSIGSKWTTHTNYGVITGRINGIFVLDIDTKDGGIDYWNRLELDHYCDGIVMTRTVRTGSGGLHLYFLYEDWMDQLKGTNKLKLNGQVIGIDLKTNNQQVVLDGSIHPDTGERYVLEKDYDIKEMPEWLKKWTLDNYGNQQTKYSQQDISDKISTSNDSDITTDDSDVCEMLMELLDICRDMASNYDDWRNVGFALHTISGDMSFDIFNDWSERYGGDKYTGVDDCFKFWSSITDNCNGKITIGSIFHWAKQRDRKQFNDILQKYKQTQYNAPRFGDMTWNEFLKKYNRCDFDTIKDMGMFVNDLRGCLGFIAGTDEYVRFNSDGIFTIAKTKFKSTCDYVMNDKNYIPPEKRGRGRPSALEGKIPIYQMIQSVLERIQYESTVYVPGPYDGDNLNLFVRYQGQIVPFYVEHIQPILDHVLNVLCSGREDIYNYVLKWMAWVVQKKEKPRVALVFISTKFQVGKTFFWEDFFMQKIVGLKHAFVVDSVSDLTTKFNIGVKDTRLLIVGDSDSGKGVDMSKLKKLVTDRVVHVEGKNVNEDNNENYSCIVINANHVRADYVQDLDKRFCVVLVEGDTKPREYYDKVWAAMEKYSDEFYSYLAGMDLTGFDPTVFPVTEIKKDIMEANQHHTVHFFKNRQWNYAYDQVTWVPAEDLYKEYQTWCEKNGIQAAYRLSSLALWKRQDVQEVLQKKKSGIMYYRLKV